MNSNKQEYDKITNIKRKLLSPHNYIQVMIRPAWIRDNMNNIFVNFRIIGKNYESFSI